MAKTREQTLYRFEELSENAQDDLRFNDTDWHADMQYDVTERLCEIVGQITGMNVTGPRVRVSGDLELAWSLSSCQGDGVAFYGAIESKAMLEALERDDLSGSWVEDLSVIGGDLEAVRTHLRRLVYHNVDIKSTSNSNHYCHYNTMTFDPTYNGCEHDDDCMFDVDEDGEGWLALVEFLRRLSRYCEREGYEFIEALESTDNLKYHYAGAWFDEDGKLIEYDEEEDREDHVAALEHADTLACVERQKQEHPSDCLFCEAGEPLIHNYEPPEG